MNRNTPYTPRAEDVLYRTPLNVFYSQGFKSSDLAHLLTEDGNPSTETKARRFGSVVLLNVLRCQLTY